MTTKGPRMTRAADTAPQPAPAASDGPANATPDGTAARLLGAALHHFGHRGFAATSTRQLAEAAGVNIAAIAYHFGSKTGLRLACADEITRRISAITGTPAPDAPPSPAEARARLEGLLRAVAHFLLTAPEAEDMAAFVLREITDHGPAFDRLYDGFFAPKHREICALWGAASGQDAESEAVRLSVFAMIGQVAYFRIARPVVLRRMGWDAPGLSDITAVQDMLVGNLRASLERSLT
ncbi:CerR family C-terminal domain-containing protein [Phaeovulum sp. W22_SRMD_FR3]|uniref:CerR family C-terminal domain-containing protein n=1 Tax=Phaeovulum sp. W22_SRMD_FR3 TaxID=3240274 RepID=UPI003F96E78D